MPSLLVFLGTIFEFRDHNGTAGEKCVHLRHFSLTHQLRHDILLYRVRKDGIKLNDDIITFVANNVTENIRDLEGVLVSLLAYSTLTDSPIDLPLAQVVVGRLVALQPKTYNTNDIIRTTCQYLNISDKVIAAKTRTREAVRARNIVMYLIKKYTDSSLAQIGAYVHRDHATVAYSLSTLEGQLSYDAVLRQDIKSIENALGR